MAVLKGIIQACAAISVVGASGGWGLKTYNKINKENNKDEQSITESFKKPEILAEEKPSLKIQPTNANGEITKTIEQIKSKPNSFKEAVKNNNQLQRPEQLKNIAVPQQNPPFTKPTETITPKHEYLYMVVLASEHENQPDEEIEHLNNKNYKCQWTDIISKKQEESDCFIYKNTQSPLNKHSLNFSTQTSSLLDKKASLKENRPLLLQIENSKYSKKLSITSISLINKKDNKKYALLSEVTHAWQLEFSSFHVSFFDTKRLMLWEESVSNEFMVKLSEKVFNYSAWMDRGLCQIEGQEKTWECSILKHQNNIIDNKFLLTEQESKFLFKATQAKELILNSNYFIFASPEIRLKRSELTGKKISFFLNGGNGQKSSNAIFKFNYL